MTSDIANRWVRRHQQGGILPKEPLSTKKFIKLMNKIREEFGEAMVFSPYTRVVKREVVSRTQWRLWRKWQSARKEMDYRNPLLNDCVRQRKNGAWDRRLWA